MPELPEVETVRKGLHTALQGAVIERVILRREGIRIPFPKGFTACLTGQSIQSVQRRAKYLLFYMENKKVVIAHLGMSGRFLVVPEMPRRFAKHDHVAWQLSDGRAVIFNDARRFGLMTVAHKKELSSHILLSELGPEPLDKKFSAAYLKRVLESRRGPIKPVLMDQRVVVGVGNIYASESLFLAGISPHLPAYKAAEHGMVLVAAIRKVLRDAIKSGGSSLRDFLHVSGEAGFFQHQFNVYDRKGEPCVRCRTPIREGRHSGRSTYWCPRCQK